MDDFDMEIDFLNYEDAVQNFLIGKLKLAEERKVELRKQLERRQIILEAALEKYASLTSKQLVKVEQIWKKLVNNKYVIGLSISGITNKDTEINVILSWKEKSSLNYSYSIAERFGDFYSSTKFPSSNQRTVLVIIPLPTFTYTNSFRVDGILTYTDDDSTKQILIPTISLEASDVTTNTTLIKKHDILTGDNGSLLALMAASEETKLFIYFHQSTFTTIEDLLEMNCFFRQISAESGCLFYVGEASDHFDGAILQLLRTDDINLIHINMYTRTIDQLLLIIHHLYKNIPEAVFLPLSVKKRFIDHLMPTKIKPEVVIANLKSSLQAEVHLVEEFFQKYRIRVDNPDDISQIDAEIINCYKAFKNQFIEQEMKSETFYSSLKHCIKEAEGSDFDDSSDSTL